MTLMDAYLVFKCACIVILSVPAIVGIVEDWGSKREEWGGV